MVNSIKGRWLPTATANNLPSGEVIVWKVFPSRGSVGMVSGKVVAKVRKAPNSGWIGTLTGYVFQTSDDSVARRFGVKESTTRRFNTRVGAQKAIDIAWSNRPK